MFAAFLCVTDRTEHRFKELPRGSDLVQRHRKQTFPLTVHRTQTQRPMDRPELSSSSPPGARCRSCTATLDTSCCCSRCRTCCTCAARHANAYETQIQMWTQKHPPGPRITYVSAPRAEHSCDPLWTEGRPTQQTVRLAVPTRCLLDVVQASRETPECEHTQKVSRLSERLHPCLTDVIHATKEEFGFSLDPLLLHGLDGGCSGQDSIDDLLLLIRELVSSSAARHVHGAASPEAHRQTGA